MTVWAVFIDQRPLGDCKISPEQKDQRFRSAFAERGDHGVGQLLPAEFRMAGGGVGANGQHTVEQEHPSRAHPSSEPDFGTGRPRSAAYSLKMFRRLGGNRTPAGTEKARPCA